MKLDIDYFKTCDTYSYKLIASVKVKLTMDLLLKQTKHPWLQNSTILEM